MGAVQVIVFVPELKTPPLFTVNLLAKSPHEQLALIVFATSVRSSVISILKSVSDPHPFGPLETHRVYVIREPPGK